MKYALSERLSIEKICDSYILVGVNEQKLGFDIISRISHYTALFLASLARGRDTDELFAAVSMSEEKQQEMQRFLKKLQDKNLITPVD